MMEEAAIEWLVSSDDIYVGDSDGNQDNSSSESDSEEISSDIEFQLYSQVHYSADPNEYGDNESNIVPSVDSKSPDTSPDGAKKENICLEMTKIGSFQTEKAVDLPSNKTITETVQPTTKDETPSIIHKQEVEKKNMSSDEECYDSDSSNDASDFTPESWEIVDSVETTDSDDQGVNIHISRPNSEEDEGEDDDRWTPGKGPKSCWKIDDKDQKSLTPVPRGRARYYTSEKNSSMRCRNCDETGHKAIDCTGPKKQEACYQCGIRGHKGRFCPDSEGLIKRGRGMECKRCGQLDHIQVDCPDLWRQYHVTTKPGPLVMPSIPVKLNKNVQCYNCAYEGHFGHECEERRHQTYFSVLSPFVYRYDNHGVTDNRSDLRKKLKRKKNNIGKDFQSKKFNERTSNKKFKEKKSSEKVKSFSQTTVKTVREKISETIKIFRTKNEVDIVERNDRTSKNKKRKFNSTANESNFDDRHTHPQKRRKYNSSQNEEHWSKSKGITHNERFVSIDHSGSRAERKHLPQKGQSERRVTYAKDEEDFPRNKNVFYQSRNNFSSKGNHTFFSNDQYPEESHWKSKSKKPKNVRQVSHAHATNSVVSDRGFRRRINWKK